MKELNNEKIDFEHLEEPTLTSIEKKAIKKRIKKKLNTRRFKPGKALSIVASFALVLVIAINSNFALADIPIVGEKLEAFVYANNGSLHDYKTVIGDSVKDNNMKVTLNEVILDEGQLLISSTFHTNLDEDDLAYNWFTDIDVYIDGKKITLGGGGGPQEITNSMVNYFWSADIGKVLLQEDQLIRIVFNDLKRSDSEKTLKGAWEFEFVASGDNLAADTTKIPIHQHFVLESGQNVEIEALVLTPVSTKLTYTMTDTSKQVYFKMEDEHGEEIQQLSAKMGSYDNYNRFAALEGGVIKIIPYSYTGSNSHKKEVMQSDEIIEINIDQKKVKKAEK
ncbi:DUF4179 domain-containing protein [Psychrobacillus sp. NPDC096426]|uniref:DUF4179 domain-containing protein n=1 Tax=Psychrobacillus sp. NPDC096426 TaxID=3364491 RepID=UPI003808D50F